MTAGIKMCRMELSAAHTEGRKVGQDGRREGEMGGRNQVKPDDGGQIIHLTIEAKFPSVVISNVPSNLHSPQFHLNIKYKKSH